MSSLPVRLRVAVVFAVATALVLSAAVWFVYARVGADLSRSLDQALRSRAQDLTVLARDGGSVAATGGSLVEEGESFAEVVDAAGVVVDATPPIGETPLLRSAELARARRRPLFRDTGAVPGLDEPARMLAVPLGSGRVLVVGATRENRAETLRSLRDAFLVGGPIALALVALGGYTLAGAALRPIERMRRRAAAISGSSAGERLPVPPTRDEVARLGETLNEMLARLDSARERERRFVADASHELRTPLALLRMELELALRRPRSREELERALASAASSADRLARLAEDLLLLARAQEGRVELARAPVDVHELLDRVAGRFSARAEHAGRSVQVDVPGPLTVDADAIRLEQAVSNLVDNGFRHGRGPVRIFAKTSDGAVEIHVRDDGDGFPASFVGRAFERFSRASADAGGSGLGLAIVETIARAHGGEARIVPQERGADVCLALPRQAGVRSS